MNYYWLILNFNTTFMNSHRMTEGSVYVLIHYRGFTSDCYTFIYTSKISCSEILKPMIKSLGYIYKYMNNSRTLELHVTSVL